MPNWCYNQLAVSGPANAVTAFDAQFKNTFMQFNGGTASFPMKRFAHPETQALLKKHVAYRLSETTKDGYVTVHYIDSTQEKTGYSFSNIIPMTAEDYLNGWYDWSNNHWGTKWDIDMSDNSVELTLTESDGGYANYSFETAWSPPEPVVAEMARQYPQLEFEHTYDEGGMQFAGVVNYVDGEEFSRHEADADTYLAFKRDVFDHPDILQCPHGDHLFDRFCAEEDEDGTVTCPECEGLLTKEYLQEA